MIENNDINQWADFWFYKIGVNVIPANTRAKTTLEKWSQWQDKPIPDELHEWRKKSGKYNNGIAVILGKIWRGHYKGKYLVAIDLDNKKAIEEFVGSLEGLEELKQVTLVEQHSDPNKMHIYFIVDKEIPNKTSDKTNTEIIEKINTNEIPALEVKSNNKCIMFCTPSSHKNGSNYRIIGTLKPKVFEAFDVEQRIRLICQKHTLNYGINNDSQSNKNLLIEELFKSKFKILEGHNRHEALLRVMESLLQRNKRILQLEKIKNLTFEWNQEHCRPPLDDKEFEKQWKKAIKFIQRKSNYNKNNNNPKDNTRNNNGVNDHGYDDDESSTTDNYNQSTATILLKLAEIDSRLFKDQYDTAHAIVNIKDYYEVLSIEGTRYKRYLSKLYYDKCDGKIANAEAINSVVQILQAKAEFESRTIPLHLRVARSENKDTIYYDLTDEKRCSIKITKDSGWEIVENQLTALFTRYPHHLPQVEPTHDYHEKIFDEFINSLNIKNEKHKLLIKVYIITLLIPDISHPILLPHGEKGSAKSTLQKKIKLIIDPSILGLLTINNDKTEFIQQLSHNWLAFYDNVRYEPKWLSDEACIYWNTIIHRK